MTINLTDELYQYVLNNSLQEPNIVRQLREETAKMPMSAMQTPPEETQFLTILLRLMKASRILEIGTFTGYSTLWFALTIPEDGKITACDIDEKWTSVGKKYWEKAGVAHKIDLRIAPALKTIDQLLENHKANYYDFIFIDADKENYMNYYEKALLLVKPDGIIVIDNVLWGGSVINPLNQSGDVKSIRKINEKIMNDTRVHVSMLPIGDGVTFVIPKNK
ncbi:class I SAM-dependent methyltransferase [Bacillus mobilis]|uniref:class I SAM-dependent methyltransferase n=1 Tax=Bacillus cereus group TaxID=86661 RepID=UPI001D0EEBD2|nr:MULTISPECIES: class I SAM-dependent methyltransferase [Bacillus cereus group]MCC2329070.1 class I SAM-dependent methyltransferase [Bacillus wiedmannii]MED0940699.1 class I SAM-dependent methyltransferase [Bacillus mobilis]